MVKRPAMSDSSGFTLPLALVVLLALAIVAGRIELASSYRAKRDNEEELIFRGLAYMQAIQDYYLADPIVQRRSYPKKLEELVSDPRFGNRRHIRQLYKDPMTGLEFMPILAPDGTIIGVASRGTGTPFKTSGFPPDLPGFGRAEAYTGWEFLAMNATVTRGTSAGPAAQANAGATASH
jgi:type II secretory pathway pseudopilin PulG